MNRGKFRIQELKRELTNAKYGIVKVPKGINIIPINDDEFIIKSSGILVDGPKEMHSCKINGETYEFYIYSDLKWYEKILRKIKKWFGIVSPSKRPWEEQNCDLSKKGEQYAKSRLK